MQVIKIKYKQGCVWGTEEFEYIWNTNEKDLVEK